MMKTSEKGIELIKKYEGCMLKAYKCPSGVWTIGFGHVNGVKQGEKITKSKAESLLKSDLKIYESKVMKYDDIYHFNQNQFDALVSFCFNVGNIDTLTRKGTRTIKEIADSILLYNKGGGTVLAGLVKRRKEEQALFLSTTNKQYRVTAVSGLVCREKTNINSRSIGIFSYNSVVELIEDCTTWLLVSGKDVNGKPIIGYSYYKYLKKE